MTFHLPDNEPERQIIERMVEAAVRVCAAYDDREDVARAEGGRYMYPADVHDLRRYVEDARYMGLLR